MLVNATSSSSACTLIRRHYVTTVSPTVVISGLPSHYRQVAVHWNARHDQGAGVGYLLAMRVNGDTGAKYHGQVVTMMGGTVTPGVNGGSTYARVGVMGGITNGALAGYFAGGVINFHSWSTNAGPLTRLHFTFQSQFYESGTVCYYEHGGHFYDAVAPYTSLTFFPFTGSIQAGSEFSIYGYM